MRVQDKVAEFSAVKDQIEKARTHLMGGNDLLRQAIERARAAAG